MALGTGFRNWCFLGSAGADSSSLLWIAEIHFFQTISSRYEKSKSKFKIQNHLEKQYLSSTCNVSLLFAHRVLTMGFFDQALR